MSYQEWTEERRERIATAVMAGFAAAPGLPPSLKDLVSGAVRWADALIAELDKQGGEK